MKWTGPIDQLDQKGARQLCAALGSQGIVKRVV